MSETEALGQLNEALVQIDQQTTKAGTALTAVQAKFDADLAKIKELTDALAASDSTPAIQEAIASAQATSAKLGPIADALTTMAGSASDPVPTPIPDPTI